MDCKTVVETRKYFDRMPDNAKLCPDCYFELGPDEDGELMCPNEVCLNQSTYDKQGNRNI